MSIRKKWGLMLLTTLLSITIVGCGEKQESSTAPKEETTKEKEKTSEKPKEDTSSKKQETPKKPEVKKEDIEAEVMKVLQSNAEAVNKEDLNQYMESITSSPAVHDRTKQMTQMLFDSYDLNIELSNLKLITFSDATVTVEITQKTTSKVPNPLYRDNIATTTQVLIKEGDKWKISATAIKKMTDLNGNVLTP
jgi:predicted small lipoprotein YifL